MTIREILEDRENRELISLENERGELKLYKQIATIRMKEKLFCLLKPLGKAKHTKNSAIVYRLDTHTEDGVGILTAERDKDISRLVYNAYRRALRARER